jgi:ribonuclease HI
VSTQDVKDEILKIAPNGNENIVVIGNEDLHKADNKNYFKNIIKKYKEDPISNQNLIANLSSKQKTELIEYLLK